MVRETTERTERTELSKSIIVDLATSLHYTASCNRKYVSIFNIGISLTKSRWFQDLYLHLKRSMKIVCAVGADKSVPAVMSMTEISRKRPLCTDSVDEVSKTPKLERVKRKKMAVLMSYSGAGYLGMQRNPGRKTIEEELLTAMKSANLITEEAFEHPQEIQFQRAARTDKGVSAARQIVSLKLPSDGPVVESINKHLPSQIRVIGMKRVTKGFNSKTACDARTYSYMLPTYAFDESMKSLEEPVMTNQDPKTPVLTTALPKEDFRLSSEALERVNEVLKLFEGTHNFHNFTSRKKPMDPSAQRYIMSMKCGEPEICENVEFATITVKGQSFMLHQIRKMVGLAIAVIRGLTSVETIVKAWKPERLDIPIAPSLGLVLEEVHYDKYNRKFGSDGMHDSLTWAEYEEEIAEFKKKYISSMIIKTEIEEKSMLNWLPTLPFHSFDIREQNINQESDDDSEESRALGTETCLGKVCSGINNLSSVHSSDSSQGHPSGDSNVNEEQSEGKCVHNGQ
ncbi:hypothetical protein J437_LFUL016637 [Ladona fulva]|uniref:Pseudouridylate synthase 1 homolog n=1 Tax=Ladona fulva TaxID=123851 RepID=A0A8K0KTJ3_LADFU|nr:hypothetical protein J437_LFUL016637 [Ladona fulva]